MDINDILSDFHPMEYIGTLQGGTLQKGYWVKGSKIYSIGNNDGHFQFVLDNPSLFDIDISIEPLLSEQIMKKLFIEGWLRIRYYTISTNNGFTGFWLVGCDVVALRKPEIKDFCYWAIKENIMGYHDKITLMGQTEGDAEIYYPDSGGVTTLLQEKRSYTNI